MATQTATFTRIFSARGVRGMKQTTNKTTTFSRSSCNKTRTVFTTKLKRKRKTCATNALFGGELTNLDLNDVTTLCANGAFLSLFVASTVYGTKAVFFPDKDEDEKARLNEIEDWIIEEEELQARHEMYAKRCRMIGSIAMAVISILVVVSVFIAIADLGSNGVTTVTKLMMLQAQIS